MRIQVKAPELSESVQSGTLLDWRKRQGDRVERDEILADLETDKVILEITAPETGVLTAILVQPGTEVKAGAPLAVLDTEAAISMAAPATAVPPTPQAIPAHVPPSRRKEALLAREAEATVVAPQPMPPAAPPKQAEPPRAALPAGPVASGRGERREPMSRLRRRIAERLKEAQNNAAMLTTFNEVNMQPVQDLRARQQEGFHKGHGVKLGLMSFFVQAVCQALRAFPTVNASVDGQDIVFHDYYDIGIAVSSERGLVVPVLRDADRLSFADIERHIADFGRRASALELHLEELEGGTFTISNGGVFGSMLSTPILNPPQSGVLGLHRIQDRPVVENGQVVIRPMMYLALSYDHRLIDGREAVSFLRRVKETLEDPARLLLEL